MIAEGIKTELSDKAVTENFVNQHLLIGIDALKELQNKGLSVKHLRFE